MTDNETITIPKEVAIDVLRYIDATDKMLDDNVDLSKWGVILSHYLYGGETDPAYEAVKIFRQLVES